MRGDRCQVDVGAALFVTPFLYAATTSQLVGSMVVGGALILLSLPCGSVVERYASRDRYIR